MFPAFDMSDISLPKEKMAQILRTSPEALAAFERSYQDCALPEHDDDLARANSREAVATSDDKECDEVMVSRIVDELLPHCNTYTYLRGESAKWRTSIPVIGETDQMVTLGEIEKLPKEIRPQLTSRFVRKDLRGDSASALCFFWDMYKNADDEGKRRFAYHHFRQGLDILDLDPVLYEMLGMNKNSMGYWLPRIVGPVEQNGFFKIPNTTVMKVPLPVLQLTRTDFDSLTGTTLEIVDRLCQKAFDLDESKSYFIKTGTYSSKFDFRNARVADPEEVREIGEYLLYIQHSACMMAGPLAQPSIYGVSTTNEWCVREYIPDVENNPTIYKGLPLHTEYRFFVDFVRGLVLGVTPYWEPETMKRRFAEGGVRGNNVHDYHDYVIYQLHEKTLMDRYNANVGRVKKELQKVCAIVNQRLCDRDEFALYGQWSIDIMQNGDDFWLIDMALAENSAFYDKCVPADWREPLKENWIPRIPS